MDSATFKCVYVALQLLLIQLQAMCLGSLAVSVQHLPVSRPGAGGADVELREVDTVVVQLLLLL